MERPREKPAKARKLTPAEVAAYKEQQDRRSDPGRVKFCYDEDYAADVQITPGGGSAGLHSDPLRMRHSADSIGDGQGGLISTTRTGIGIPATRMICSASSR